MQTLRNAHLIARFVLVWFALSLGAAVASPIVQPKVMDLICSGAGVMKLMVQTGDGSQELSSAGMDCPLCAASSAPPPPGASLSVEPVQPLGYVLQSIPSAIIAARTAAPLPARGPPSFS
jgi:hypothetical protein